MNYAIHKSPFWAYEVVSCLCEYYMEAEEKVIANHTKFGMTKEKMESFFEKYKLYKKAVLEDILPLYDSNPSYHWLFEPIENMSEPKGGIALGLVTIMGAKNDLTDEDIDDVVKEYITDIFLEYDHAGKDKDVEIEDLQSLVTNLVDKSIDDSLKVKLIKLYNKRYENVRGMWELVDKCVPACKRHFHIIEDDYMDAWSLLNEVPDVFDIFDSFVNLKNTCRQKSNIYVSVFGFNSLRVELKSDVEFFILGMYFLKLYDMREKNKVSDESMVSALKALSDPTRIKIIRLLKEKDMYMKEIADNVNLTPATVSHHMDILMQSEIVSITVGDESARRVYYQLNTNRLGSIGYKIVDLAMENQNKEEIL